MGNCPPLPSPLSPLGIKKIFGRFLASISVQVWRNITKNTKNADFKKTGPPAGPVYCPSWPPWRSKNFLGGFWHLSQLKFEEISPKILRMQILRKLAPQLPPITRPPGPPGGQKKFWEVSGIYLCPTHPIWPKKLGRITSFGQIDAWPPLWVHCAW